MPVVPQRGHTLEMDVEHQNNQALLDAKPTLQKVLFVCSIDSILSDLPFFRRTIAAFVGTMNKKMVFFRAFLGAS